MLRKLLLASALFAMAALAFGQTTIEIQPTTAPEVDDVIAKGATSASVQQQVRLVLPEATALHLDAATITFDLSKLDGTDWATRARTHEGPDDFNLACVYSNGADRETRLGNDFWNQLQVIPGGIAYTAEFADYPTISIEGEEVVNYPPLKLDADGELVPGSKDYIVCYQSFIIQLFSNFGYWDLQVSRNDTAPGAIVRPIEHLYVQGNVCSEFGEETGLYALNHGAAPVHLIPRSLTAGTTGMRVNANCGNTNTSWLDVLGVLAVKVNSDFHGTSVANLTYTLVSSNTTFP